MLDGSAVLKESLYSGLRPDDTTSPSEWGNKFRFLSSASAAEPGRYRIERTPYWREVLDDLSPLSPVKEVVVIKSAQIGFTEAITNWLGFIIHIAPGPTMVVQPTLDLAKRYSKQRVNGLVENTPVIGERIADARSRDSGNTVLLKEFDGGLLSIAGANSAAALRSIPIKYLALDEEDAYPDDVDGEGSPTDLAKKRTRTFARKKIIRGSTPLIKGESKIEAAYEATDQRRYFVPCPHCDHHQHLKFMNLKWDKVDGKVDHSSVHYECEGCNGKILEHHKTEMFEKGEWRSTKPENETPEKRGYHLSGLYSPVGWLSWVDIVKEWYDAQGNYNKLQAFVNTTLGEAFEIRDDDTPEWREIYNKREPFTVGVVPIQACLLTASVDVQKDRFEMQITGWNRRRSWIVDHIIIPADTSKPESFNKLTEYLDRDWNHASGMTLRIEALMIDSGYNTTEVYGWVRKMKGRKVFAIKGQDTLAMPVGQPSLMDFTQNGRKIKRGVTLWKVGTNVLKRELYNRLKLHKPTDEELKERGYPDNYLHIPELGEEFCKQIVGEQYVMKTKRNGHPRYEWVKTHPNNEALDCACYNIAAWYVLGCYQWSDKKWDQRASAVDAKSIDTTPDPEPQPKPKKPKPKRPSPPRSSFW